VYTRNHDRKRGKRGGDIRAGRFIDVAAFRTLSNVVILGAGKRRRTRGKRGEGEVTMTVLPGLIDVKKEEGENGRKRERGKGEGGE